MICLSYDVRKENYNFTEILKEFLNFQQNKDAALDIMIRKMCFAQYLSLYGPPILTYCYARKNSFLYKLNVVIKDAFHLMKIFLIILFNFSPLY